LKLARVGNRTQVAENKIFKKSKSEIKGIRSAFSLCQDCQEKTEIKMTRINVSEVNARLMVRIG
jgi:hypothetical protein